MPKKKIKLDSVETPEKTEVYKDAPSIEGYYVGQLKHDAKSPKFNHLGWLMADAVIAKVGVIDRSDIEKGRKEFVSEDELFKQDSLNTLQGMDIEQHHGSNYLGGVYIGPARKETNKDGIFLVAPVAIKNKQMIQDVLNNRTSEVSPEYETGSDVPTRGKFDGIDYNYLQKDRIYRKITLVRNGTARGGRNVRIKLDSTDGQERYLNYIESPEEGKNTKNDSKKQEMVKMKFGKFDIDVPKDQEKLGELYIEGVTTEINTAKQDAADWKTKYDGLEAEVKPIKEKITKFDSEDYKKQIIQEAKDRVKLENEASGILTEEGKEAVKFDGKTDTEIRKEVLVKFDSTIKFDGLTDDEIKGEYNATLRLQVNKQADDKTKYDSVRQRQSEILSNLGKGVQQAATKHKTFGATFAHLKGEKA